MMVGERGFRVNENEMSEIIKCLREAKPKFPPGKPSLKYNAKLGCWTLLRGKTLIAIVGSNFIKGCLNEHE